ncbi:hypothetical protein [Pseudonocardia lacus]|uniref:hypothetical protein n=1 Tax=Pseudonocardia lacus TaxID=2835865 RepID=UPI001BDDA249|nr:hypothetical protein [Pseudonocardia lacus]
MTRLRAIAPLLVAAALTAVAFVTAKGAGCDDPGRYELQGESYVLIGGCVAPGDLVVPDPAPPARPADAADAPAKG